MEMCKDESQVVMTQQKPLTTETKSRPVLVSSEKNNAAPINGKPRTRYKSSITSTPRSSPNATRQTNGTQRSQSAERSRPASPSSQSTRRSAPSSPPSTPLSKSSRPSSPSPSSQSSRSTTPIRDTMVERLSSSRRSLVGRAPDGLWPSIRSLSASFQSDSSSVSSTKSDRPSRNPSPDPTLKSSERKKTPLRENSKPIENPHVKTMDQLRWPGMTGGKMLTRSVDLTNKITRSASLSSSMRGVSPIRGLKNSTNELVRPGSSNGREKPTNLVNSLRNATSLPSERAPTSTRQSRSPSPIPNLARPSSPNKASVTRAMSSPTRKRPSSPSSSSTSSTSTRVGVSSSILNYLADVRKGKRSPSHIEDAHQLRLLHSRDLQWRFVNARADAAFSTQKLIAEDMLYNVRNITSELYDSVVRGRINVQVLGQEKKLRLIINEQIAYLENWSSLEADHSNSLLGTIGALKASTLRLPVTGRTRADIRDVKNAISSAVDVMQAMGSSICYLLSKVEATNSLISELSELAATESTMLDECRELLASTAAMQVQECSLKTHLIQLRQQILQVE